jgi:hypothetical protein
VNVTLSSINQRQREAESMQKALPATRTPGHTCTATGLIPCHIGTGTGLTPCHIRTVTSHTQTEGGACTSAAAPALEATADGQAPWCAHKDSLVVARGAAACVRWARGLTMAVAAGGGGPVEAEGR